MYTYSFPMMAFNQTLSGLLVPQILESSNAILHYCHHGTYLPVLFSIILPIVCTVVVFLNKIISIVRKNSANYTNVLSPPVNVLRHLPFPPFIHMFA